MTTKQTAIRIPVGLLEAIDARRDADHDRTTVIIGLLTSALTGEYIKPKENTTQIISKLTKTVKSLEVAIDELSFQIKKQTRINNEFAVSNVAQSLIIPKHDNPIDDKDVYDDELVANQDIPDNNNYPGEDDIDCTDDEDIDEEEAISVESEVMYEPARITHQKFIDRFGCCDPSDIQVVLTDGEILQAITISKDTVIARNNRSPKDRRLMIDEIAYYQSDPS